MVEYALAKRFQYSSSAQTTVVPWPRRFIAGTGSGTYPIPRSVPDRFTEFETYDTPNWDGDNAEPITRDTVGVARRFNQLLPRELRPADIAPGADGTIGFEWRVGYRENRKFLLVEIGPGDIVKARKITEKGVTSKLAPIRVADRDAVANLHAMLFPGNDVSFE